MSRYRILAGLQVLDVLLTGIVLHLGGSEQNGVMRLLTDLGIPGLLAILAVKLSCVYLLARRNVPVSLANAVYGAVVFNNALFLALYATGARRTLPVSPFVLVAVTALMILGAMRLRGHGRKVRVAA